MRVIVGGCGRLGVAIAESLSRDPDTDVIIIDTDPLAFDRLGSAFNGETLVGNCNDRDVLEAAGVAQATGLFAVTRSDNTNLMTVQVATHLYGVPRTIARLFNPEREKVYQQLGIRYVSPTSMIATSFLNEFHEDAHPLHVAFEDSEVSVVTLVIAEAAHALRVEEFEQDGALRVAAVTRGGRVFIPHPSDRLERDDVVTAAMKPAAERAITDLVRPAFGRAGPRTSTMTPVRSGGRDVDGTDREE